MVLRSHALRPTAADDGTVAAVADDSGHLLHGQPGATLTLPAAWMSLWLPLRGALRLRSGDCTWSLPRSVLQVWCGDSVQVQTPADAHWLCLAAPVPLWSRTLPGLGPEDELLPWQGHAPRELQRQFVHLARTLRRNAAGHDASFATLLTHAHELQAPLASALARSPGRTVLRRRQTLLRLLRVRHRLACQIDQAFDLDRLAATAHYSPCHLARLHRQVFAETLGDYALRLRNDQAWHLLRDTALPVGTITHALGFESQSAFCRAFKQSFGMTATQARHRESLVTRLVLEPQ